MIIILTGLARSGKDTVGKYLVDNYNFNRLAFADKLKEAIAVLDPYVGKDEQNNLLRLSDIENVKEWAEIRRLYQVFGSDIGRELFDLHFWIDFLLEQIDLKRDYVITDCRFPNELETVSSFCFVEGVECVSIKIERPGTPEMQHQSETHIKNLQTDFVLVNGGTLDEYLEKIENLCTTTLKI